MIYIYFFLLFISHFIKIIDMLYRIEIKNNSSIFIKVYINIDIKN